MKRNPKPVVCPTWCSTSGSLPVDASSGRQEAVRLPADNRPRSWRKLSALAMSAGILAAPLASAQSLPDVAPAGAWQYSATIYAYLPALSGSSSFPTGSGGSPIDLSVDKILSTLKFTFMGDIEAHNGQWGAFTDVIYFDLGADKTNTRDFSIGNIGLPAGTTANLDLDLKAWIWTLAGAYRVASSSQWTVDVIGGARMLDLRERLKWNLSGNIGPIAPPNRIGSAELAETNWDAIVGVKGRYVFGANRQWSIPFYLDVGAGESQRTWQAAGGVGYAFSWGELSGLWRTLDYQMKSGDALQSLRASGPMIAATFRW